MDYAHRDKEEKILLAFVEENFKTEAAATELNNNMTEGSADVSLGNVVPDAFNTTTEAPLLMTEQQLNGTERFAADGITDANECHQLMDLTAVSIAKVIIEML